MRTASIAVILTLASGCSGGGSSAPDAARLDVPLTPTMCTDPLHTGLTAVQTGVSADACMCAHMQNIPLQHRFIAYMHWKGARPVLALATPSRAAIVAVLRFRVSPIEQHGRAAARNKRTYHPGR